jgi:hypothetical protein
MVTADQAANLEDRDASQENYLDGREFVQLAPEGLK